MIARETRTETRVINEFKCTICGASSSEESDLDQCRDTPTSHPICLSEELKKKGFTVTVWETPWWRKRGVPPCQVRYTALPFFANYRTMLSSRYLGDRCFSSVPLHTLCVSLCQDVHGNPWKFGGDSRSWFTVTWDDYLLLEEGNPEKLMEAKLLPPPTRYERFKRFVKRMTSELPF